MQPRLMIARLSLLATLSLAVLAISATPSFAHFAPVGGEGNTTANGTFSVKKGLFTFTCKKYEDIWIIETNEQIREKTSFKECKWGIIPVSNLKLVQNHHQNGTVTILSLSWEIESEECKVETGEKENEELKEAVTKNIVKEGKQSLEVEYKIKGIKYKTNGKCGELTKEEKGGTLEFEGTVINEGAEIEQETPYWDQCSKTTKAKEGWYKNNLCTEKATTLAEQNEWEKVTIEPGKKCVFTQEINKGPWVDSECKKENANHTSAWASIAEEHHKFTSKQSGVENILESKNHKITCKEGTNKGEKTGPQHFVITITLKGCGTTTLGIKVPCGNKPLAASQEIETSKLEGTLVYSLKEGKRIPGVLITVKTKGENFAVFKCGPASAEQTVTVDGGPTQKEAAEEGKGGSCLLGEIKPINKFTKTGELLFNQEGGAQVLKEFEYHGKKGGICELKVQVEKEPKEQAWMKTTDEITFEDATFIGA